MLFKLLGKKSTPIVQNVILKQFYSLLHPKYKGKMIKLYHVRDIAFRSDFIAKLAQLAYFSVANAQLKTRSSLCVGSFKAHKAIAVIGYVYAGMKSHKLYFSGSLVHGGDASCLFSKQVLPRLHCGTSQLRWPGRPKLGMAWPLPTWMGTKLSCRTKNRGKKNPYLESNESNVNICNIADQFKMFYIKTYNLLNAIVLVESDNGLIHPWTYFFAKL